jgi:hypothetical protein
MSTDSAGVHGHRRVGEPAWRNPVANQAFDGFDPHNQGGISNGTVLGVFVDVEGVGAVKVVIWTIRR